LSSFKYGKGAVAPGSCFCLLYDLAKLEELTQLLAALVKAVVKGRQNFSLPVIC